MSVENKDLGNNHLPDIKELLKSGDINLALAGLGENSQNTLAEKQEELQGFYEMAEFTCNLDENQVNGVNNILAQFILPQNSIA